MPNRDIHNLICKLAGIPLNKANTVNKEMDLPSQFYGGEHRFLFHGQHIMKVKTPIGVVRVSKFSIQPKDILEIYMLTNGDPDKLKAWYLHILMDGVNKDTLHLYKKK